MMHALGAKALATSSAAQAFTLGLPDNGSIGRDAALAHAQDILSVVTVPVQGDFENGFVEYSEELGLYRVFREYEGKKLGGFWDLVTVKPVIGYEPSDTYKGLWVGSCHQNADGVETSCSFFVDVMGMYTKISASEDDYLRLNKIKTMVATHLQGWVAATM